MIDFIEYVVAELKRKRLSRADALELIRQFSRKSPGAGRSEAPQASSHPLLQANTSDLSRLGFSSVFTGEESFLADHRILLGGQAARKVLPGAACLEMARAAAERVFRAEEGAGILKLTDIVWLHPLLVEEPTEVSLTLYADDPDGGEEGIGFEISSASREEDGQAAEKVHCQGHVARVARVDAPASARLDLDNLRSRMGRPRLDASRLYATYRKVGAEFGPTHRSLAEIHVGEAEALARLVLPAPVESLRDMPLHPSLLDGALQACIGLLPDPDAPGKAALPFALENLEVLGPCVPEMFAWIRHAPGSGPADRLAKVDIDLCDAEGALCVRLRGFSSRASGGLPAEERSGAIGLLLAAPTWKAIPAPASLAAAEFSRVHVLLFGFPDLDARALEASLPGSRCRNFPLPAGTDAAGLYSGAALEVFGLLRELMGSKSTGQALVQIAVAGTPEGHLLAGLEGLLKTARLENPQVTGQLLLVPPELSVPDLAERLREGRRRPQDTLCSHLDGQRRVSVLAEIPEPPGPPPLAFKSGGVYLITGGLGGLGTVFARAILEACGDAQVILSGRSPLDETKRARLAGLAPGPDRIGTRVSYRQADIAEPVQARGLVAGILEERGRLDGILHAAGIIRDGYILKKSAEEFRAVLAPKVAGTVNLDEATRDLDLDFLVLFSSGAAVTGNAGQSDYAAANGFLDRFAGHRNILVTQGARRGKTLSIDWPLWQEGGMGMDEAGRARARSDAGMHPMRTTTGLRCFHRGLALGQSRLLAVEGELARLRGILLADPASPHGTGLPATVPAQDPIPAAPAAAMEAGDLEAKALDYIKGQLAALLKAPAHRLDPEAPLERYGIDSILAMNLTGQLEKTFGPLSKTLFFEYQTLRELAAYFVKAHGTRLAEILS
ncbi:MAG TPA: SDR family NAD(P)-dependent oxidoreductase, partial [Fibrobacteria bacterium]|nr:SDR family NAD(P)-dependent oxidoreductase [Fibrobacteria bacterium]